MSDSMTGQQIYENFTNAPGAGSLMDVHAELAQIQGLYNDRAQEIKDLAASMEEHWTGDAAGAASRGAGPLAVEHERASQEMNTAKDLLTRQAESFVYAKNRVQPVPPLPAAPPTFAEILASGGRAVATYEEKVVATNTAAQANVDVMTGWTSASTYNGTMMPTTYGHIDPNTQGISTAPEPPPPPLDGHKHPGGPDNSHPQQGSGDTNGGGPGTAGSSSSAPGGPGGGTATPGPGSGAHAPGGGTAGDSGYDATTPGGYTPPPATGAGSPGWSGAGTPSWQTSGSQSPSGQSPGGGFPGLAAAGFGTGDPGSSGAGSSPGGRPFGAGAGAGGGSGSSGGSGSGSGPSERLTGGRGSGAAAPGTPGEAGTHAGGPGAGGKGTPGKSGMPGGMGAGGQKGGGGEDQEHQRKFVQDDDEHFQLTDDGEQLINPRTGMRVMPPVIGL